MSTSEDKQELKESEEITTRHDCESEKHFNILFIQLMKYMFLLKIINYFFYLQK